MMKNLILIVLLLFFTVNVMAQSALITDVTKGPLLRFTPGSNVVNGKHYCTYNYDPINNINKFNEFMDGATSFSYDVKSFGGKNYCINIKTDVSDIKVNIPYVNQEAFKLSSNPPLISSTMIVTASTPEVGSIFTLSDHPVEMGVTNVSVGTYGDINYFVCEVYTNSAQYKWLLELGINKEIKPGGVLKITYHATHKQCGGMSFVFNPALLYPPVTVNPPLIVNPPALTLPQCPVNCIK